MPKNKARERVVRDSDEEEILECPPPLRERLRNAGRNVPPLDEQHLASFGRGRILLARRQNSIIPGDVANSSQVIQSYRLVSRYLLCTISTCRREKKAPPH